MLINESLSECVKICIHLRVNVIKDHPIHLMVLTPFRKLNTLLV